MVLRLNIGIEEIAKFYGFSMVANLWSNDGIAKIHLSGWVGAKLNIKFKELEVELILDLHTIYNGFKLCPNWICAQFVMEHNLCFAQS